MYVIGIIGAFISSALGGWDFALHALVIFMAIDMISGWIVAAVFKKSKKTETGALRSDVSFRGLFKKVMLLLFVLIGYRLDYVVGVNFIRYGVIIALLSHELTSIIENAGLMGIPLPPIMQKALDMLHDKSQK
jgi:toxin secretion/phage lysis holin